MLDHFIQRNRADIIARAEKRVVARSGERRHHADSPGGIPHFLDCLRVALETARSTDEVDHDEIARAAGMYGVERLEMGLTISQVVHDYGDVCQVITELAIQHSVDIPVDEFRTLNLCLDDAIAGAVSEYTRQAASWADGREVERAGVLAHELRNLVNSALLSHEVIRTGSVAANGSTSQVLGRSLLGIRDLVDRSLAEVRLDSGAPHFETVKVAEIVEELGIVAALQARQRGIDFVAASVDRSATLEADRLVIMAALSNLVQNALKFTRPGTRVTLTTRISTERVLFEIEDECGGLPPGKAEGLFRPFEQRGADRSGLGLGLSICLKAANAHGGRIRVRDLPGHGCIFVLDLPRKPSAPTTRARRRAGSPAAGRNEAFDAAVAQGNIRCLHDLRILLVDVDDQARALLRSRLEENGAVVTVARSDGDAAPCPGERPHVVITNLPAPHTEARAEGLAIAREALGNTPSIALSVFVRATDHATTTRAEDDDALSGAPDYTLLLKALTCLRAAINDRSSTRSLPPLPARVDGQA